MVNRTTQTIEDSHYKEGYQLGIEANVPPTTLNQVTPRFKGKESYLNALVDHDLLPNLDIIQAEQSKMSFRRGYVEGLRNFAQTKQIPLIHSPLFGLNVVIFNSGLEGFIKGLTRQSPNTSRDYRKFEYKCSNEEKYLERTEAEQRAEFEQFFRKEGYGLGFTIGVAKDFDCLLSVLDVPSDNPSYTAFMQGLNAEGRPMLRNIDKRMKNMIGEILLRKNVDEKMYSTGVGLWLVSNKIKGVSPSIIRHPEALRAFKAAISGEVLSEYELSTLLNRVRPRKEDEYERLLDLRKYEYREPTAKEIAEMEGWNGYHLGKKVREAKK